MFLHVHKNRIDAVNLGKDVTNIWAYLSTKVLSKKNDSLSTESLVVVLG